MIRKQYQGVALLILIIVIMLVVKIKFDWSNQNNIVAPVLEPTPTLTVAPSKVDVSEDYPLIDELPYSGKGFTVDKYTAPMTLQMTLTTATKTEASKAVTIWINTFKEVTKQHKIIITN